MFDEPAAKQPKLRSLPALPRELTKEDTSAAPLDALKACGVTSLV